MRLVRGTGKPRVLLWQFGDLAISTLVVSPGRVSYRYLRIRPSNQEHWHEAGTLHLSSVPRRRDMETTPPGEMVSCNYTTTIGLLWLLLAAKLDEYRQHAVWVSSEGHAPIHKQRSDKPHLPWSSKFLFERHDLILSPI